MFRLGTWPAIISTGDDAAYAVLSPAAAFRRPGPGTTRATPKPPPARAAVGHVAGGLLVTGGDEADVLLVAQAGHGAVELHAGQAEDHTHALAMQLPRERFAAGHPRHYECFRSSRRPIWRRCTSSGPSAKRSVRECAHMEASGNSWLTPPPPCSCMARSTTASVMLGTATLISAMACLAALLPTVSIM